MLRQILPTDPVDLDLGAPATPPATPPAAPVDGEPAWQRSTIELLKGVEVTDFSDTISGDVFQELFLR
ncbi:MAG TPA: hypothetical protein VNU71_11525 [Burkholderiaceae bacterium]|nr:hypothetical protein [Burkholderiaceae bacterium]